MARVSFYIGKNGAVPGPPPPPNPPAGIFGIRFRIRDRCFGVGSDQALKEFPAVPLPAHAAALAGTSMCSGAGQGWGATQS